VRARNVAAVNYHFGGKRPLYVAVVKMAIEIMRETNELSVEAGRGASPDDQLRAYVRVFLTRLMSTGRKQLDPQADDARARVAESTPSIWLFVTSSSLAQSTCRRSSAPSPACLPTIRASFSPASAFRRSASCSPADAAQRSHARGGTC
jgi:AcrR family transcriptional regulator